MELGVLRPDATLLAIAVVLDFAVGDPQYRLHPIRLMGHSAVFIERVLRSAGLEGYGGGILLTVSMAVLWCGASGFLVVAVVSANPGAAFVLQVYLVYSLLALRNLLDHAWAVEVAARQGNIDEARHATAMFVARDTGALDLAACRRAAVESTSENLTDGYASPIFWYAIGGLPGIVLFKVVSTLDSMVGNKSERYLRFGWCSARTDDVLNWIPARLAWLLIAGAALFVPRCSMRRALALGWQQHALVPGPNSGWSEAAFAGAMQRRLVGPIVLGGKRVTDLWLGDRATPAAGESAGDIPLALTLCTVTALAISGLGIGAIAICG